jgi:DNA-binding MarR family transcriptional regulator
MANKNNLFHAHAAADEKRTFNQAVVYSHITDGPKFVADIARRMNLATHTITEYCKFLEEQGYIRSVLVSKDMTRVKMFFKTEKENFPWPAKVKNSADIKREYFNKSYPGIHQALLDAIYDGRISPDVIKSHRELDTDHWVIPKKDGAKYRGNFQSSLSGEYSA